MKRNLRFIGNINFNDLPYRILISRTLIEEPYNPKMFQFITLKDLDESCIVDYEKKTYYIGKAILPCNVVCFHQEYKQ